MLTLSQINRLNALLPGESTVIDGKVVVCHESRPYLSFVGCLHCALHRINCTGVNCMKGILVRKITPNDPEPLEIPRQHDAYFTLHY